MRSKAPITPREVLGYSLMILGAAIVVLSATGLYDDQLLVSPDFCGTPLAFPACAEVSSQSMEYVALIAIGVGIVVLGMYLGLKSNRRRRRQQ